MASPFFARIKRDCLAIVACVPEGKVCTYSTLGKHLDVPPRHVAYVLATLTPEELTASPWWRVVGEGGKLGKIKLGEDGVSQAEFLENEGISVQGLSIMAFEQYLVDTLSIGSGVPQQKRPDNAPNASKR